MATLLSDTTFKRESNYLVWLCYINYYPTEVKLDILVTLLRAWHDLVCPFEYKAVSVDSAVQRQQN